jgi:hypothetical protein
VPEAVAPREMLAHLVRGDDEAPVLDGPGAQQDLPVRRARVGGERRRDAEDLRAPQRQRSVETGKAQVVADGQTETDRCSVGEVDVGGDHLRTGRHLLGLLVAHRTRRHVEEVDLAVRDAQVAGGVEERRDVGDEAAGRRLVDGAGEQPDTAPGRRGGEGAVGRSVRRLRRGHDARPVALEGPGLRQGDEAGALVGRRLHKVERGAHVGGHVVARVHLDAGDAQDAGGRRRVRPRAHSGVPPEQAISDNSS